MRHKMLFPLAAVSLLFLTACVSGRARGPSGEPSVVGVLVQATAGRCTSVLVGTQVQRVCLPPPKDDGATPPDTASTASPDTAAASVR